MQCSPSFMLCFCPGWITVIACVTNSSVRRFLSFHLRSIPRKKLSVLKPFVEKERNEVRLKPGKQRRTKVKIKVACLLLCQQKLFIIFDRNERIQDQRNTYSSKIIRRKEKSYAFNNAMKDRLNLKKKNKFIMITRIIWGLQ